MKIDIAHMNGYPVTIRGIPAICLLNTKVSEWIENNHTVPQTIRINAKFSTCIRNKKKLFSHNKMVFYTNSTFFYYYFIFSWRNIENFIWS